MAKRDYYETLSISKNASEADIKKAFRSKAREHHPDKNSGSSKAEEEFKTFVESSNIPAAWTILGVSALPSSHPLNMGMVGMHGNYGPNVLTNECDVLIAVGMRFDDRVTGRLDNYAKQAKVVHFEIDPAEINKNR